MSTFSLSESRLPGVLKYLNTCHGSLDERSQTLCPPSLSPRWSGYSRMDPARLAALTNLALTRTQVKVSVNLFSALKREWKAHTKSTELI